MRRSDVVFAILSGILLALSFPRFGHAAIGWIALTPLLIALVEGKNLSRAFLLGLTCGLVYFAGTLYWLTRVMTVYSPIPFWLAVCLNAAFVAYLALFPATFAAVMRFLVSRYGRSALLAAPFVWVSTELGRTYIMTGFPWVLLGYSQAQVLPIAQLASLIGVFGVSALVAAVSAALANIVLLPRRSLRPSVPSLAVVVLTLAVAAWGSVRLSRSELTREGEPVRVGLIQANVDQAIKWDPARRSAILQDYLRLTREAIDRGARFVLWPESSTPFKLEEVEDRADALQVRALASSTRVPILLGSDQVDRTGGLKYYNAAFMVGETGETRGVYRKMHLVPWGEYVPLSRLLFFVGPLVETVSEFSEGDRAVLLPVGGHRVGTAICYEIVYPELVRRSVVEGSELLTTITNDAWFGPTSAPFQHFEQASMRAIEEGRYLVRSANTGISGIVDPYGRVLARSGIYQPAVVVGEVRFLQTRTLYSRTGDAFAYGCLILTVLLLASAWRRGR